MADPDKITVVVPAHNESGNIGAVVRALDRVFDSVENCSWSLLFVDDGSRDGTWDAIREAASRDERVKGLRLSRNFGKEMALTAGIDHARGADAVIFMDADLQHPPELIPHFIDEWRAGNDIVAGVRKQCADYGLVKNLGSKVFYKLMIQYSELKSPPNTTDFRLLDKKVAASFGGFKERIRMFRGLVEWMGFKKKFVDFEAPARTDGRPAYSLKKLVNLALTSFTSFSLMPLRIIGVMGMLVVFFSFLILAWMVLTDFFQFQIFTPLAYFVVFNTFLVGVLLSAMGLIGLYIGHIHMEVIRRPLYLVSETTSDR